MRMRNPLWACLAVIAVTVAPAAQQGARGGEWTRHSGDPGSTKYAPLDQINKDNVSHLRIAWRRPAVDPSLVANPDTFSFSHDFRATPLMIDGLLYSSNGIGLVEAFHPGTGKTVWIQQPFADEPEHGLRGTSTRAVAYWADGSERRLFVIRGEYLIALDPRTGGPITTWGIGGRVHLKPGLGPRATTYSSSSGPQVCGDVVIAGANMTDAPQTRTQPPGNVQAFDVRTGKPRWTFHVIPQFGEVGNDTWERDSWAYSGQANLWSLMQTVHRRGDWRRRTRRGVRGAQPPVTRGMIVTTVAVDRGRRRGNVQTSLPKSGPSN